MSSVGVRVLGPVAIVDGSGTATPVRAPQEQVLLVALVLASPHVVSTGKLIDIIWGEAPPSSAGASLKALVHRVRRKFGRDVVATSPGGYRLGAPLESDHAKAVAASLKAAEALREHEWDQAVTLTAEAEALFSVIESGVLSTTAGGRALAVTLAELHKQIAAQSIDARLGAGEDESLIGRLEERVAAEPLAERNWERLMIALYRSGRQAASLGAFQRARAALVDGAGLEPGPELQALERRIIEQDSTLLRGDPAASRTFEDPLEGPPPVEPSHDSQPDPSQRPWEDTPSAALDLDWLPTPIALVGRHRELAHVWEAVEATRTTGRQRFVVVNGNAGMGKTRLLAEIAGRARSEGMTVLYGRCDPDAVSAHRPFAQAFERLLYTSPDAFVDSSDALVASAARVAPALGSAGPVTAESGEAGDIEIAYAAFAKLLAGLGETNGAVLLLDDLHWARPATISLLRFLVDSAAPSKVPIIGTYRPRDLDHGSGVSDGLADLHRHSRTTEIELRGLDHGEVAALIAAVAQQGEIPDELTSWVVRATSGVPYLIGETLRHLVDNELIVRRQGRWQLGRDGLTEIPTGVRLLVGQQLARLSESTRSILMVAAVAGLEFDLTVVAAASDAGEAVVLDALEGATLEGLVEEVGFGRWRWSHDLARKVVVDSVSLTRQVHIHWRLAETLNRAARPDHGAIARHAIQGALAGDPRVVASMLRDAANHLLGGDPESALACAKAGLEALAEPDADPDAAALLVIQAIAHNRLPGEHDTALVARAEQAALASGDTELIVRAITLDEYSSLPAYAYWVGTRTSHLASIRSALAQLPVTAADERALVLNHALELLHHVEPDEGRIAMADELEALLRGDAIAPLTRHRLTSRLKRDLPIVANQREHARLLDAALRSKAATLEAPGGPLSSGQRLAEVIVQTRAGRFDESLATLHSLLESEATIGQTNDVVAHAWLANILSSRSDVEGLRAILVWLEGIHPSARTRFILETLRLDLYVGISLTTGEPLDGLRQFETRGTEDNLAPALRVSNRIAQAWLAHEFGARDLARSMVDELIATNAGAKGTIQTAALLVELLDKLGSDYQPPHEVADALAAYSGEWIFSAGFCLGPIDYYLARLDHVWGRDPSVHLDAAMGSAQANRATFWVTRLSTFGDTLGRAEVTVPR